MEFPQVFCFVVAIVLAKEASAYPLAQQSLLVPQQEASAPNNRGLLDELAGLAGGQDPYSPYQQQPQFPQGYGQPYGGQGVFGQAPGGYFGAPNMQGFLDSFGEGGQNPYAYGGGNPADTFLGGPPGMGVMPYDSPYLRSGPAAQAEAAPQQRSLPEKQEVVGVGPQARIMDTSRVQESQQSAQQA